MSDKMKRSLKKAIDRWEGKQWVKTGKAPGLIISDFGTRIEIQFPEIEEEEE